MCNERLTRHHQTFLCDVLDNGLTRLSVPESLMKMFLYILRECGVAGAPTLYGLRKIQQRLRKQCGVPTLLGKSPHGNVFWMIDPRTVIAKVSLYLTGAVQYHP